MCNYNGADVIHKILKKEIIKKQNHTTFPEPIKQHFDKHKLEQKTKLFHE